MTRLVAAFRNPDTRPRAVIRTLIVLIALVMVIVASLTITSTRWFCNEVCHTVHYDNARQYAASSHANVSCLACHIPPNLDGARFTLEKAEKLADVWAVATNSFEMPLNPGSHIALTMPADQCTQCHDLATRDVTPGSGIRIDHDAHADAGLNCTVCHNRVAHPEIYDLELPGNEKHEDFMKMTACFRCHTQTGEAPGPYEATGECSACHTDGFELKPPSHFEPGFYELRGDSSGHARLAREEASSTAEARAEWDESAEEFRAKQPKLISRLIRIPHGELIDVPPVGTINECETCHDPDEFCEACHQVELPHPAAFIDDHAEQAAADPVVCATCHNRTGDPANDQRVCDLCHHSQGDPAQPWFPQHPGVVRADGAEECFRCHTERYCSSCHVQGAPATPY